MDNNVYAQARQIPLEGFLEAQLGAKPKLSAGWARFSSCPACGEGPADSVRCSCRDDYWRCWRCDKRGDIVDAAVALWGCSKIEAARRLVGGNGQPGYTASITREVVNERREQAEQLRQQSAAKLHAVLHYLVDVLAGKVDSAVMRYLVDERKIAAHVVEEAMHRGMLLMLPGEAQACVKFLGNHFSPETLIDAGLWRAEARWPKVANRPLWFVLPNQHAVECRIIQPPRENELKAIRFGITDGPWLWKGTSAKVTFVEGMIDLLSMVSLGYSGSIAALPGCNQFKEDWLACAKSAQLATVILDNDEPGQRNAAKLVTMLTSLGITAGNRTVPHGKDVNDYLRSHSEVNP